MADRAPDPDNDEKLAAIRAQIDATDDQLLRLLNERARLVSTVADLKTALQVPFYVPSREKQIAERLSAANPGPFSGEVPAWLQMLLHLFCEKLTQPCRANRSAKDMAMPLASE